jgi:thiosulfate/3-mercaptopyruvate sulfurtransferase
VNLKSACFLVGLAGLILISGCSQAPQETAEPGKDKQLMDPAALAKTLNEPHATPPVIFNVGPVAQIKGAIHIGPTASQDNLDELRKQLAKLPKGKEVVVYCGCCPFRSCPNVGPAFELLTDLKFTQAKLLNLPTSLNEDWVSKGYPME